MASIRSFATPIAERCHRTPPPSQLRTRAPIAFLDARKLERFYRLLHFLLAYSERTTCAATTGYSRVRLPRPTLPNDPKQQVVDPCLI